MGEDEGTQDTAKDTKCSYKREDGNRCEGSALEGSKEHLCILHATSKDAKECLRAFYKQMDEGSHDFEGYQLPEADLSGRVFHGDVTFRNARFTGDVTFKEATFPEQTDLRGATFEGDVSFEGVEFGGSANVAGATFKKEAIWKGVTFGNEALFEGCAFGPMADFDHGTFTGDAHFERARISGDLDLGYSEFKKYSFFIELECEGEGDFSFAEFMAYADFAGSRWKELNMTDVIFDKRGCFDGAEIVSGTFEDAELRHVTFRDVDMANVFTTGASLEEAYMSQAKWGKVQRGPLGKKLEVREETLANEEGTKEALNRAEAAHRNLKESYKNEGDYETAGEFFIREMAIRRKRAILDKEYGYWVMSNIIAGLCGYGERPTRVIFWWFAFTFTFAVVYFAGQLIEYSDGTTEIDFSTLGGFLTCMYFSVVTFTTLGFGDISPVTDAGRAIASVEAFTGAFMIALFVLVFGRKMIR
jgi:uncharacterized protein YjbI with pentapeptide repeats